MTRLAEMLVDIIAYVIGALLKIAFVLTPTQSYSKYCETHRRYLTKAELVDNGICQDCDRIID